MSGSGTKKRAFKSNKETGIEGKKIAVILPLDFQSPIQGLREAGQE
jgi:hypothetical protein